MKRNHLAFLAILTAALLLSGCGTTRMPAGSVFPGLIYTDVNYPSMREAPQVRYDFKAADIELLGPVTAKMTSMNILGIYAAGDNGYKTLLETAKREYPGADDVINLNWDTEFTYFGLIYIPIFQRADSTLYGTAVKIKRQ